MRPEPGPLGRGVIVTGAAAPPDAWANVATVRIGEVELHDPTAAVARLGTAWLRRQPVVVALDVDAAAIRSPESTTRPPYELGPRFTFERERLHFLLWANNYDDRAGEAIWWHGRKAVRQWPSLAPAVGPRADVLLPDGRAAYIDGGPPFAAPLDDATPVIHRYSAELGPPSVIGDGVSVTDLAADQRAAVLHPSGAARIIAPAGSGKTRVLTERLRHLVVDRGAPPQAVTALAFNTLAAEELKERSKDFVTSRGPHIRTLNSLGLSICNEFGGRGRLRLAGAGEVRDLIQEIFSVRRQANADPVAPYIEALSAVRLGLLSPPDAEEAVPDASGLSEGFDLYREALARIGALDFDEQIYRALEILLADPEARRVAAERCRWLLVDEFQDLHPAHLLLVRLLAAPAFDCFGVGDDDQVLYGYSGATPQYLINFATFFPGASEHALEQNYRCPPEIVDAARHLLGYNTRRVAKMIRAARPATGDGARLVVRRNRSDQLADAAVATIMGWRDDGVELDDMVVLARVNSALLAAQVALREANINCEAPLDASVLDRTGMRTALAYLRIGGAPERISRQDVLDTIRRPSRGIAPKVVEALTSKRSTSLRAIRDLADRLTGRDAPKVTGYAGDLAAVVAACRVSSAAALRAIQANVGLGETMDVLDGSRRQADRSTHADDLRALEAVAALHPEAASFEAWLRDVLNRPRPPGPAVLLSTVHRVKGREWGNVLVFGLSEGTWPHRLNDDEEEERRVLHVALTRARERAVLIVDDGAPSPFVGELDGTAKPRSGRPAARERNATRAARPQVVLGREGVTGPGEEALRTWRRGVATRSGIPAFVVLNDVELSGIAAAHPATLAELATCRGMGPVRLERWGDEILAVLDGVARS